MEVFRASIDHLEEIAVLFDLYRQFYQEQPDLDACRDYLRDRLVNGESVVFAARDDSGIVGFTQLYHTFCSVEMAPFVQLYDLYVAKQARRQGVARALMERARVHAQEVGACRLQLETAFDNKPGQSLYEGLGWKRDEVFYTYHLEL